MAHPTHPYYQENLESILAEFEPYKTAMQQVAPQLLAKERLPKEDEIQARLQRAWDRFAEWLPELYYIGGEENYNTGNLVFGAWLLCVYQELSQRGYSDEQVGLLLYETILPVLPPAPAEPPSPEKVAEILTWRRANAQASMIHKYPYDWQTTFLEGDTKSFDWGVDYHTCGICRLFAEHGALDFLPYACFTDLPSYRSQGIGLVRTKTLSRGDDRCDFRFNLRGEYSMEWYPDYARE